MKKFLVLGLAAFLAAGFIAYRMAARHAFMETFPAGSQIYIHGTPVCVYTDGKGIFARVGPCDTAEDGAGDEGAGPLREGPFRSGPGMALPPGHPPVGEGMVPEKGNVVKI